MIAGGVVGAVAGYAVMYELAPGGDGNLGALLGGGLGAMAGAGVGGMVSAASGGTIAGHLVGGIE